MNNSLSSFRPKLPSSSQASYSRLPNPSSTNPINSSEDNLDDQDDELNVAFNDSSIHTSPRHSRDEDDDDDDDDDENQGLVPSQPPAASSSSGSSSGSSNSTTIINNKLSSSGLTRRGSINPSYDFERDSASSFNRSRYLTMANSNTQQQSSTTTIPSSFTPAQQHQGNNDNEAEILGPPTLLKLQGMGGGVQNDGVFSNLSAKPDGRSRGTMRMNSNTGEMEYVGGNDEGGHPNDKEESLPTYDTAALDSAPPYWETTVTLPGVHSGPYGLLGPDDVLVEGLPVGNLFGFAWNLLVSMSFQFIGFLLTYLLHTTHAAKNGSRAGLGITLIQYGLYTRTRTNEAVGIGMNDEHGRNNSSTSSIPPTTTDPWGLFGPSSTSDWDGSTDRGLKGSHHLPYDGISSSSPNSPSHLSGTANDWLGYILIAVGWFLLLGGLVNYWRAVRWAKAVRNEDLLVSALA